MSVFVSVIIPVFNRSELLGRAIDSVLQQDFFTDDSQWELIIVDDASADNIQALVPGCENIRYIRLDENRGVSHARNIGIKQANGEWLAFLDSDDEWLPKKLSYQFTLLENTSLQVCHTEEIWIRNGIRVNQMKKHAKKGGWIYSHCLPLCAISPSSVLLQRSVVDSIGLFDENLPACEDYDYWLRLTPFYEVAYVEQALVRKYGGHGDQLSRRYWGMDRFRVIALEKSLGNKLEPGDYVRTHDTLIQKLWILQSGAEKHQNTELLSWCRNKLAVWQNAAYA